jgi:hypothetical protein
MERESRYVAVLPTIVTRSMVNSVPAVYSFRESLR